MDEITPELAKFLNEMHLADLQISIDELIVPKLDHESYVKYDRLRWLERLVKIAIEGNYPFSFENVYKHSKGKLCKYCFDIFPELVEVRKNA